MKDLENRLDRIERQQGAAPDQDDGMAWRREAAAELRAAREAWSQGTGKPDPNGPVAKARALIEQMAQREQQRRDSR